VQTATKALTVSINDIAPHTNRARNYDSLLSIPLGFDRLREQDWTADDIASLRATFLVRLARSHAPHNMPAGEELRALEDQWLDSTEMGGVGVVDEEDEAAALDDRLWGSMMGFFWPPALILGARGHGGAWSERRRLAVVLGVLINLLFGVLRATTGRWDGI
jgi:DUF2407 C-terminal domain